MSVGFGTPVTNNLAVRASFTLVMSSVTSGQPILVYMYKWATAGITSITDDFSTPYSWTRVDQGVNSGAGTTCDLWIGTGGVGTSGTITVNTASNTCGGAAVACTGASTAAGLSAVANHANGNGTSTTPTSPSVAGAAAGDGAIAVMGTSAESLTKPGAPWTSTFVATGGGVNIGGTAVYPALPDTSGVTAGWTQASAAYVTAAATIKAAAAADMIDPMGMSGFFGQ